MRVGVTGANGFVGRHLCRWFEAKGHHICAVTRSNTNMSDVGAVAARIKDCDVLVHCAGRAHILRESSADPGAAFHEANVALAETVARASVDAQVARYIFISSAGVLGNSSEESNLTDESPSQPYNLYSASKWEAEQALTAIMQEEGLSVTMVRPPLIYGPGAIGNFARLVQAVSEGWPLPINLLNARRSIIGIRNFCDFVARCATEGSAAGETFLVSDDKAPSYAELIEELSSILEKRVRHVYFPKALFRLVLTVLGKGPDYQRLTRDFVIDSSRARRTLNWEQPYSQNDELRHALQLY